MLRLVLVPLIPGGYPTAHHPPLRSTPPGTAAVCALGQRLLPSDEMEGEDLLYFCDYSLFPKIRPHELLCLFVATSLLALCGVFSPQGLRNPPVVPGHGEGSCGRQWVRKLLAARQDETGQSSSAFANAKPTETFLG